MRPGSVFGRIQTHLRPHRGMALLATGIVTTSSLLGLLTPWPIKIIVDSVLGRQPLPGWLEETWGQLRETPLSLLLLTLIASLTLTLLQQTVALLNAYLTTRLTNQLHLKLRSDLFHQAQKLALSRRSKVRSGDILNNISVQAGSIGPVALAFLPLSQSAITLVGMFSIAFVLDADLALLSLVVVPFLYWSIGYYARRIEPQVRDVRQQEAHSLSLIGEGIRLAPITHIFGRQWDEQDRFRRQSKEALDSRLRLTLRQTCFSLGVHFVAATGTALVLGVGAMHVLSGELSIGLLLVVITYIGSVYTPLQSISGAVGSLQEKLVDVRMLFELLDQEPEIFDRPGAVSIGRARGEIEFEGVSFAYDPARPILRDISFRIRPGQFVALVGATGVGKTTLLSLFARFNRTDSGRILLDGQDIAGISLESLWRQISLVTQEPLLSSASLGENIRYGKPEATLAEVEAAARAAQIHPFIQTLPQGYDTLAGECSGQLSMGERQRISLARAFLKNAPILLLDEPTSSLDKKTEEDLLGALSNLMHNRTTLMVAHRLSSIQDADLILVLESGRLREAGTHRELMEKSGVYRGLQEAGRARTGSAARPRDLA